jgi:predicted transcriptional regulator of viral defense system
MEFETLLTIVGDEPLFESALLLAGEVDPANIRLQLTRWKNAGRIFQLRRGLYALAPPYQRVKPHPFLIANQFIRASYVSCQSALGFYELIPENVYQTISVTGSRPGTWKTPLGTFHYHHIKPEQLCGYRLVDLGGGQQALVATPEKALLDLIYLQPRGDSPAYLNELRLQNLDRLNLDELESYVENIDSSKLWRALEVIQSLTRAEEAYETL